ncbi:MAG: hypothetical protein QM619_00530, partial [Micropruina sp.]|uniref:hypothetical protein n=1 Tax=Micropruina sp. TaxID=2737536 RepID=UPI0039E4A0CB
MVVVLLLVGCSSTVVPSVSPSSSVVPSSSVSAVTPTAVVSPMCSPMGGTPVPCSPADYEKTQEQ